MIRINKNILSEDLSPYLQQHKDNPVNWQTWSKETLDFAKENKKPILLILKTQLGLRLKFLTSLLRQNRVLDRNKN